MEHFHIQKEAYDIYIRKGCGGTAEQNWYEAIDILSIFPEERLPLPTATEREPINPVYKPVSFGVVMKNTKQVMWMGCRELFDRCLSFATFRPEYQFSLPYSSGRNISNIMVEPGVAYYRGDCYNVAKMIRTVELSQKLQSLSKFSLCEKPQNTVQAMRILPSSFWLAETMRISLFSLLLRAGEYFRDNPSEAIKSMLDSYKVLQPGLVFDAVKRFFEGNYHFTGVHDPYATQRNWINVFSTEGNEQLLVPDENRDDLHGY